MAISSPLRTAKVKSQSVPLSNNSIKNIQETLIKQKKVKKEILDRKNKLQDQRRENERRQQLEDQLEAPNLVITPSGPIQMIQNSTKGFLERILGFLGYLTAGWLMNNLATWIAMGKEFIGRVQRLGQIITGLLDNTTNIFIGFGNLLSAAFQNLIQFDLFDTSNRVNSAFENLNGSINDMGKELEEAIQLITSPLSEGITTGENAPSTGSKITDEGAYEPGAPYSGSGGAVSGDNVDKKVLDFIADGEASQSDPYGGFNTSRGKTQGRATDKTIGWLAQNAQGAIGRYQHMPKYILDRAIAAGFDANTKFTPEVQDKITLHFLKTSHSYDQWKSGKLSDEDFLGKLSPTWRAIPQGPKNAARLGGSPNSTYNDRYAGGNASKGTWEQRLSKLKSVKSGATQQSSQSQTPTPAQITSAPMLITSGFGWRWGRQHQGIDLVPKTGNVSGTPVIIKKGGQVDYAYIDARNMGMILVTHEDGTQSRYLHVNNFKVKKGQKISSGQTIASLAGMGAPGIGNATGPHLHFEYYSSKKAGPTDPGGLYQNYVSLGGKVVEVPSKPLDPQQSPRTPDKSSPSQPEPQIGSVNSQGKIYVDSKYGYQSRATVIAKGLLPSQNINPQPSTPQQNLVNPPGALAPGQRPDRALTSEQLKIAQQTREQGKASGLTGEALEKSVAAAVMASYSTTQQTPAQISQSSTQAQQNQQLSQQTTPDRKGQTIIFQQPSQSQSLSYSTGGGSGMMPISVNEIALVNNFMKKKLLLDLAYL
jgi:murein DD-endopeptidase MepM/ murein hydrolase activator NlpD